MAFRVMEAPQAATKRETEAGNIVVLITTTTGFLNPLEYKPGERARKRLFL